MLTEPLIQQLTGLRLHGMAASLEQQLAAPDLERQSFENRLGLMIQQEVIECGFRPSRSIVPVDAGPGFRRKPGRQRTFRWSTRTTRPETC